MKKINDPIMTMVDNLVISPLWRHTVDKSDELNRYEIRKETLHSVRDEIPSIRTQLEKDIKHI